MISMPPDGFSAWGGIFEKAQLSRLCDRNDDIFARSYVRGFHLIAVPDFINHMFDAFALLPIFQSNAPKGIPAFDPHRFIIGILRFSALCAQSKGGEEKAEQQRKQQNRTQAQLLFIFYPIFAAFIFHIFAPFLSNLFSFFHHHNTRTNILCQYFFEKFTNVGLILFRFYGTLFLKENVDTH